MDGCRLCANGLVDDQRAFWVGFGAVEGARGEPENVSVGVQADDVVRVRPFEVDEVKGAPAGECEEVVLLARMKIKLPTGIFGIVGANGRPFVKNQVASVGVLNGDVEKLDAGRVSKLLEIE